MEPYGRSGSMIGRTLDLGATDRYISGYTTQYATLSYVGGSVQAFAGTTSTFSVSLTGLTGGSNTSPQTGDVVILVFSTGSSAGALLTYRISGYTQIGSYFADDTYDTNLQIGYAVVTQGTNDLFASITGGSGNIAHAIAVAVHVWRGVDTTTVLDTAAVPATVVNTGIPNPNGITTVTPGAQIIMAAASGHVGGVDTYTASYLSNFRTIGSDDTYDVTVGIGSRVMITPGAYDGAAWGWTQADSTSYSNVSVVIALRPALQGLFPITGNLKNSGVWDLPAVYRNKIG